MPQKKTKNNCIAVKPSPERSAIMRAVKGKDTKPEIAVRAFLRSKRFKFETYTDLPGKPDIVLPRHKVVIRVKLYDETGAPLTPNHANKQGRRYRYYVSHHLTCGNAKGNKPGLRLSAQEICASGGA